VSIPGRLGSQTGASARVGLTTKFTKPTKLGRGLLVEVGDEKWHGYQRCHTRDSSREIACDNKFGDSCRPASSLMISREAVAYCSYGREPMVGCRPHGLAPKVATAVGSIGRIPAGNRRLRELGSFFVP
jgi:hypothetical protein